jgi:hypothetical protein
MAVGLSDSPSSRVFGSRAGVGLLISPLAGTLVFTVLYLALDTRGKVSDAPLLYLLLYMPFSLFIAYPAAWAVGVPSYLWWRRRPRVRGTLVATHAVAGAALLGVGFVLRSDVFWPLARWILVGGLAGAATGATFESILVTRADKDAPLPAAARAAFGFLTAPVAAAVAFWLVAYPPFTGRHSAFWMLPWFVVPSYFLTTIAGAVIWPVLSWCRALRPWPLTLVFTSAGLLLGLGMQYLDRDRDDAPPYLAAALLAGVAAGAVFSRALPPLANSGSPAAE